MALVCTSDVAHSGPKYSQGVCVYAPTQEKLGGALLGTLVQSALRGQVLTMVHERYLEI